MFSYQKRFDLPTTVVTADLFNNLVDSAQTRWLTSEHRRLREALSSLLEGDDAALAQWAADEHFLRFSETQQKNRKPTSGGITKGEAFAALPLAKKLQAYCDHLKKRLPFVIFIATYEETASPSGKVGMWRKQKACRLNGLCVIDFDHLTGDAREIWQAAFAKLSDADKSRILLVYLTPSGHGLKVVFIADPEKGNLIDNQKDFSAKLGLNPDEACKDASRGAFLTTRDDIFMIDESRLFDFEDQAFGDKYNKVYHDGNSQSVASAPAVVEAKPAVEAPEQGSVLSYNGVPYTTIIDAWLGGADLTNKRHDTLVRLANHLRYLCGKNAKQIEEVVMQLPWVRDLAAEGENVGSTVASVIDFKYYERKPKRLREALAKVGISNQVETSSFDYTDDDIYDALPLEDWAAELTKFSAYYPCMKELFVNLHPSKMPAVLFSASALFGTLLTRTWYHFWYDPEIERRLNYSVFVIGDPGSGKNVIEKFYKKIAAPMIEADAVLIEAENNYKSKRTERTTSTKAQKGEALKKPELPIRVHPARTATGEFIDHMRAAVEVVQGKPLNLHMFSFDAELDNVTQNNRGGDWKNREVMELKAFHNEQDGQMYKNHESTTGMFNVYWNFIYTGTPLALSNKVNPRNFGSGMATRLAVVPMPDKGMAQRHQTIIADSDDTIRNWAFRLNKVEGELPIEPLNDVTFEWQNAHMEIADFNNDKGDRMLLKRIPYYGIAISLPFILMRHWEEWQASRMLTIDDIDRKFCRLVMEIQYKSQTFYFGEMAFNYYASLNKDFVARRRTKRYDECYHKLPDEFKTIHVQECFDLKSSAAARVINRLLNDRIIKRSRYGVYRKLLPELP